MLTTRTIRSRRPAASVAGRLLAHVALALFAVVGVVFAHGGACAAVELSESAAHGVHLEHGGLEPAVHGAYCPHRNLPERHHHGTEQDCGAITPTGTSSAVAMPAPVLGSAPAMAAGTPSELTGSARLDAPCPKNLCVMRI
ncbi:hypothetical protein [Nonomuraea jiangxiensis]|uniref:Uncharacterized protein n=1 Tax=Nonomuraea jiangxiensis TaxID=633440 RepID=A0A1G9N337_9ACTN|nr:hypothetical protein [Nonomuraea jiangxiensis]SDL80908.1 hypothetical protein SAMN05421869_13123 [Nonomuraea jiangxiensis]